MKILGIDPGYGRVGYGCIEVIHDQVVVLGSGVITTMPGENGVENMGERLGEIRRDLLVILERFKPDKVAVEELFFVQNVTTGIKVAEARGVILVTCYEAGCELVDVQPTQVKMALTGFGRADKKQVTEMLVKVLQLTTIPTPDDAADALAIAWTATLKRLK